MKKIAIMTWYTHNNYGSKLQATAMSRYIKKMGYDSYFINYKPRGVLYENNFKSTLKKVVTKLKSKTINKPFNNNDIFEDYKRKYIKETEKCDSYVDLYQLNSDFDAFICGSDQIWSPNNFDSKYFLDFADDNKIIAYAPSIGLNNIYSPIIKEKMCTLIKRFKYLSVREETGAEIIKNNVGIDAQVVLDPTLLLKSNEWEQIENIELAKQLKNQQYVVTYFLGDSSKYIKVIEKYAKNKNLKIYNIPVFKSKKINKYNFYTSVGPSEFLSLIHNANCVFTDSFHGTILSINYNKDFYTFKRFKSTSKNNQNSRVEDILKRLSLDDRLVINKKLKFSAFVTP